ncbi:MAG: AAA family ATPase, partial [archaeon]
GLPGTGKSALARKLAKKPGSFYFDSDLFGKRFLKRLGVSFKGLPNRQAMRIRLQSQIEKVRKLRELFWKKGVRTVFIDTCFDIPAARRLYYSLEETGVEVFVFELVCQERLALERILGGVHQLRRMPGGRDSRLKAYYSMKRGWKHIRHRNHFRIRSDSPFAGAHIGELLRLTNPDKPLKSR